ncbi:MAG: UDP-2,3-diacylglucosamine diphosphatase LpxI [Elusimicrobia bacterium]|nr:UDP-2,3-diacylglucosamine diphosphatase LpxI [Elusimicrobiota bacterium]
MPPAPIEPTNATAAPVGLIAGSGRFPVLFAEEARRQGSRVYAVALKGVTDLPALEKAADEVRLFALGQVSAPLDFLKKAGVKRVVMAGKVQHVSLFGGIVPDLRAVKLLATLKDRRTDTILSAIADEFAKEGLEVLSSATFLQHLIPEPGALTKRKPSDAMRADAALGWKAAKALAGMDLGQSVVVQGKAVVAVEAMEGTDACVRRASELVRSNGQTPALVVVKVAKPRQDFRFDLPVVGLDTLTTLKEAGAVGLALEAGRTLVFDRDAFVRGADAQGLAVWAVPQEGP